MTSPTPVQTIDSLYKEEVHKIIERKNGGFLNIATFTFEFTHKTVTKQTECNNLCTNRDKKNTREITSYIRETSLFYIKLQAMVAHFLENKNDGLVFEVAESLTMSGVKLTGEFITEFIDQDVMCKSTLKPHSLPHPEAQVICKDLFPDCTPRSLNAKITKCSEGNISTDIT